MADIFFTGNDPDIHVLHRSIPPFSLQVSVSSWFFHYSDPSVPVLLISCPAHAPNRAHQLSTRHSHITYGTCRKIKRFDLEESCLIFHSGCFDYGKTKAHALRTDFRSSTATGSRANVFSINDLRLPMAHVHLSRGSTIAWRQVPEWHDEF